MQSSGDVCYCNTLILNAMVFVSSVTRHDSPAVNTEIAEFGKMLPTEVNRMEGLLCCIFNASCKNLCCSQQLLTNWLVIDHAM